MTAIASKSVRVYRGDRLWRRTIVKAYLDAAWRVFADKHCCEASGWWDGELHVCDSNCVDMGFWESARIVDRFARWLMWKDGVLTPARKRSLDRMAKDAIDRRKWWEEDGNPDAEEIPRLRIFRRAPRPEET